MEDYMVVEERLNSQRQLAVMKHIKITDYRKKNIEEESIWQIAVYSNWAKEDIIIHIFPYKFK